MNDDLFALQIRLREFAAERDWGQFHSPKNLAAALSIEAAEVLEHFQWMTDEESRSIPIEKVKPIAEEIADVLLYLLQLADKLEIDPVFEANRKININAEKYPVDKFRGNSKKYSDL